MWEDAGGCRRAWEVAGDVGGCGKMQVGKRKMREGTEGCSRMQEGAGG